MKRALILIASVVAFIVLTPAVLFLWWFWIGPMFYPPAPLLLQHVSGASGWFGACPPRNEQEAAERAKMGEALSPELNQRLAQQFPPGSSADSLVRTLTAQGFKLTGPCQNDSTIHRAGFGGPTRRSIFETRAEIYWKTAGETVAWTKGFVMFVGL
jgi:hypothetical protein